MCTPFARALSIWDWQGALKIVELIANNFLPISSNNFYSEYKSCKFFGSDAVFVGNTNKNDKPDGLVRVISDMGYIYEGNCSNGKRIGFGRCIYNGNSSIGWWCNKNLQGNSY